MSTTRFDITPEDGWVQFADAGEDFTCELLRFGYAEVTVQDTTPDSNTPGHPLRAGTLLVRPGAGDAYARISPDFPSTQVALIVSTG